MQEKIPAIVILGLLTLVVGLPFVFRQTGSHGTEVSGDAPRLVVLTPHNAQIREEFSDAFNEDRVERGLPAVSFDWRVGGTSELVRSVGSQFQSLIEVEKEDNGIGIDLFWGGGEYDHDVVLAGGVPAERGGEALRIPMTVPFDVDEAWIQQVFPTPDIGGAPLYHTEYRWLGAALSSFGIVYNRDTLDRLEIEAPTVWQDLADPRLFEDIALADPNHSGSITAAYEAVLKRQGWNEGWRTLRRVFANTRYFAISAARVPMDVAAGEAAAGMCIDFYGRYQVGAMPEDAPDGGPRLGYTDPVETTELGPRSLTATNSDPISLMRGAPSPDLANDFGKWLLSVEAQHLWQRQTTHVNGPSRYELRRQPIRRDVYQDKAGWTDPQIDPFASATLIPPGTPNYFSVLRGVTRAMAIDNRDLLKDAWNAIQAVPEGSALRAEMIEAFDAMPPSLTLTWPDDLENWRAILNPSAAQQADPEKVEQVVQHLQAFSKQLRAAYPRGQRDAKEVAWAKFFEGQYRKVLALAKTAPAEPDELVQRTANHQVPAG